MTEEKIDDIIKRIVEKNGVEYNIAKAVEECLELSLVLQQYKTKPHKVDETAIIDEIADVDIIIRMLKRVYPLDLIEKRVEFKLNKLEEYINK